MYIFITYIHLQCFRYWHLFSSMRTIVRSISFLRYLQPFAHVSYLSTVGSPETRVLSFGAGSSGALGHGGGVLAEDVYEPLEVAGLPGALVAVACGHYHSMAVTDGGEVWAWGRNSEGQLGRGHVQSDLSRGDWSAPAKVMGLEKIRVKQVAGSGVVSMAVAEDGSVWAWGRSKRGQLGLGMGVIEALLPTQVEALKGRHVVQVALGWGHALACTTEGELLSWGYAADGRLGIPSSSFSSSQNKQEAEHEVDEEKEKERLAVLAWEPCSAQELSPFSIAQVAAGLDHSLVLAEGGELFSFGDNTLDQLGSASHVMVKSLAVAFSGRPVLSIGAGLGHSLAVVSSSSKPGKRLDKGESSAKSGMPFSWGWNLGHQLGRRDNGSEDFTVPGVIEELSHEEVVSLSGGRVHSLAVTAQGRLWAWGSGRNGRLGLGSSHDQQLPSPVEELENTVVLQAASGFDHSLILVGS